MWDSLSKPGKINFFIGYRTDVLICEAVTNHHIACTKKYISGKKFILLILSYVDTALTCVWLFLTRGNFEANILKVLRTLSGPDTEAIKVNAETISTLNFHFIYILYSWRR